MRSLKGWILMAVVSAISPLVVGLSWTAFQEAKAEAPAPRVTVVALDFAKTNFDAQLTVDGGSLLLVEKVGTGMVALVAPERNSQTHVTVWEPTFAPGGLHMAYRQMSQMPRYWFVKGQRMEFEAREVAWNDREQAIEGYRQRLAR